MISVSTFAIKMFAKETVIFVPIEGHAFLLTLIPKSHLLLRQTSTQSALLIIVLLISL